MADDPEAMGLLAGYLAQALMTYILCYAPQKIVIGGGVADHTPIVPLARKKCAEMLNGYIVTPEMADIDSYIVNNSLEGKQGIMGCLALGAQALQQQTHPQGVARPANPTYGTTPPRLI
jgi:fructokinase